MMTLDGTNTWVLREPGAAASVVVDPGPIDRRRTSTAIERPAGDVAVVLLTHHHVDHSEAAREFAERVGLRRARAGPGVPAGLRGRSATATWSTVDGLELHVVATPGHTADSLSFVLPAERRGAHRRHGAGPRHDGRRAPGRPARRLPRLARPAARARRVRARSHTIWPAHGPVHRRRPRRAGLLPRPPRASGWRRSRPRVAQLGVRDAGGRRRALPRQVVEIVYADVDPVLWGAAELSVRAQLAYLAGSGR